MTHTHVLFSIAAVVVLVCGASAAVADSSGNWRSGREAYEKVCARCHETGVAAPIKGRVSPATRAIVRSGFRQMPPFRVTEIDDATLDQLLEYLR